MRIILAATLSIALTSCGNPGGISDKDYAEYKRLGAPKLLYSCNKGKSMKSQIDELGKCMGLEDPSKQSRCMKDMDDKIEDDVETAYVAGVGVAVTYNKILRDAESSCKGVFKILESQP